MTDQPNFEPMDDQTVSYREVSLPISPLIHNTYVSKPTAYIRHICHTTLRTAKGNSLLYDNQHKLLASWLLKIINFCLHNHFICPRKAKKQQIFHKKITYFRMRKSEKLRISCFFLSLRPRDSSADN